MNFGSKSFRAWFADMRWGQDLGWRPSEHPSKVININNLEWHFQITLINLTLESAAVIWYLWSNWTIKPAKRLNVLKIIIRVVTDSYKNIIPVDTDIKRFNDIEVQGKNGKTLEFSLPDWSQSEHCWQSWWTPVRASNDGSKWFLKNAQNGRILRKG